MYGPSMTSNKVSFNLMLASSRLSQSSEENAKAGATARGNKEFVHHDVG